MTVRERLPVWIGVYVGVLMSVARAFHFTPLAAALFISTLYFAAVLVLGRGQRWKLGLLVSIAEAVLVFVVWRAWG